MAVARCTICNLRILEATSRDGEILELVEYRGPQLWGIKAEKIDTPLGEMHTNVAYKAKGMIVHECTKMPETLGAPARPMAEFPALGDPVKEGSEEQPEQGYEPAIALLHDIAKSDHVPIWMAAEADQVLSRVFGIQT